MAIRGVTFDYQNVSAKDDGALYTSFFSDSIISGCGISFSGSKAYIATGRLMIKGRYIVVETAQEFTINVTTAGKFRIICTIDLNGTASKETFDQVTMSVEYSNSSGQSYSTLKTEDINGSGKIYQVEMYECDISGGTIQTGTVVQKLKAFSTVLDQKLSEYATVSSLSSYAKKTGDTFTGNMTAYSTNRSGANIRNSNVQDSSGTAQSTNYILFMRK